MTIYISEAHSTDGWSDPENKYMIKRHVSLQERILAAEILLEDDNLDLPGTLYIDKMENEAERLYGAWPERLYVVLDGVVKLEGGEGPHDYDLTKVRDWLEEFRRKTD